ncbi:putative U6 snRNA-associated Sm-like protein LSm4 [Wickerhamiella sorbophila]|uniref:LSM complex subunit LSM4 n=1 Tax=Wickerhamiella sorbophila TaxID=45607 RepID=A0A2T0FPC6_9ASCO|nr:putative U6 snRNA-associated Sm-like protein LSm4 [Wickerhamiella sorbophila]PRT56840.1 putative U6 snRNA-associated Sm-like protein LSm4 [Wickerhamiella sorbophila]
MLPLSLLNAAQGLPLMLELKSRETINGYMLACDTFMNLTLRDVVCTSADGKEFKKMDEMFVRGTGIRYVRVPENLLDQIVDERAVKREERRRKAGQ